MSSDSDRARAAALCLEMPSGIDLDGIYNTAPFREQVAFVADALAAERERAIEPFTALADEIQRQIDYRRETGPEVVTHVREVDLQWLRLAISNAREPRQ